jgi:hypothetical protein
MPIGVEIWLVNGRKYRVVGILWGGSRPIKTLEIRFNPEEHYVRVDKLSQTANAPWSFWSHAWTATARAPISSGLGSRIQEWKQSVSIPGTMFDPSR